MTYSLTHLLTSSLAEKCQKTLLIQYTCDVRNRKLAETNSTRSSSQDYFPQ
jgi:hypothetical protein